MKSKNIFDHLDALYYFRSKGTTMKKVKTGTHTVTSNFYDAATGEVTEVDQEVKHHYIFMDDKESFFWTYYSLLSQLDNLDKVGMKVLFYCAHHAQWNTNMICLTKPILADMEDKIHLSYQTVRNAISKLKQLGIFIDLGAATYRIHPKYYWKGNSSDRLKTMKYVFEFELKEKGNQPVKKSRVKKK